MHEKSHVWLGLAAASFFNTENCVNIHEEQQTNFQLCSFEFCRQIEKKRAKSRFTKNHKLKQRLAHHQIWK